MSRTFFFSFRLVVWRYRNSGSKKKSNCQAVTAAAYLLWMDGTSQFHLKLEGCCVCVDTIKVFDLPFAGIMKWHEVNEGVRCGGTRFRSSLQEDSISLLLVPTSLSDLVPFVVWYCWYCQMCYAVTPRTFTIVPKKKKKDLPDSAVQCSADSGPAFGVPATPHTGTVLVLVWSQKKKLSLNWRTIFNQSMRRARYCRCQSQSKTPSACLCVRLVQEARRENEGRSTTVTSR